MTTPDSHAKNRGFIEGILRKIPGFQGYLEKEYRRESDHLARVWMADQLDKVKVALDRYMRELVNQAKIDELTQFESLRTRIDGLVSKMRGDVRGYSSFFDYVQVDESVLENVYDNDLMLMGDVEALESSMSKLASQPASQVASEVERQVDEIKRKYERRGEILEGVGKS